MKALKIILFGISMFLIQGLFAQAPPPPSDYGQGGNQPSGGGAPIGGGVAILLTMAAAYGGKKIYTAYKKAHQLEE